MRAQTGFVKLAVILLAVREDVDLAAFNEMLGTGTDEAVERTILWLETTAMILSSLR